ncbi:MAG: hypothetical protein Q7U42_04080 [Parvibaculum sp.]|nr:hypothetical protein [Parvibaculum sp.]
MTIVDDHAVDGDAGDVGARQIEATFRQQRHESDSGGQDGGDTPKKEATLEAPPVRECIRVE